MKEKSRQILAGIVVYGYFIDTPSFLDDGRIAGEEIRESYKELLTSKLVLRLYEGEDESGNTLMIFMAPQAELGELKDNLSSTSRVFPVCISSELNEAERNNLIELS